jgi:hypothetical protein
MGGPIKCLREPGCQRKIPLRFINFFMRTTSTTIIFIGSSLISERDCASSSQIRFNLPYTIVASDSPPYTLNLLLVDTQSLRYNLSASQSLISSTVSSKRW